MLLKVPIILSTQFPAILLFLPIVIVDENQPFTYLLSIHHDISYLKYVTKGPLQHINHRLLWYGHMACPLILTLRHLASSIALDGAFLLNGPLDQGSFIFDDESVDCKETGL